MIIAKTIMIRSRVAADHRHKRVPCLLRAQAPLLRVLRLYAELSTGFDSLLRAKQHDADKIASLEAEVEQWRWR